MVQSTLAEYYNKVNQNMQFVRQSKNFFLSTEQSGGRGQTPL